MEKFTHYIENPDKFRAKSFGFDLKKVKREFDVELFRSALFLLGFDISRTRKQGYLYLKKEGKSFSATWKFLTTDEIQNGEKITIGFNPITRRLKVIEKFWNLGERVLKRHFYSSEKSHEKPHKKLKNHTDEREAISARYFDEKTIGVNEHLYSRTACFDIDNKSGDNVLADETLHVLVEEMGYKMPILLERNPFTDASHVFYNFDDVVSESDLVAFKDYFNSKYADEGYVIDIRYKNKIFRLPCSYTYVPIKINNIGDLKEGNFGECYDDLNEMCQDIESFNDKISYEWFYSLTENAVYTITKQDSSVEQTEVEQTEVEQTEVEETEIEQTEVEDVNRSIFANNHLHRKFIDMNPGKYKSKGEGNSDFHEKLNNDYPIYADERVGTMYSIASLASYMSCTHDEFYDACMSNNVSSKDFAIWDEDKRRKEVFRFYDWFLNKHPDDDIQTTYKRSEHFDYFISNLDLLKDLDVKQLDEYIDLFYKFEIEPNLKYESWMKKYKYATEKLIKEVLCYMMYKTYTCNEYNPHSSISYYTFSAISRGFQVPRAFLESLKKHYDLKVDIHKLFNTFIKSDLFEQIYSSESGYCFNPNHAYSRQWKLKNTMDRSSTILGCKIHETIVIRLKERIKYYIGMIVLQSMTNLVDEIRYTMCKLLFSKFSLSSHDTWLQYDTS